MAKKLSLGSKEDVRLAIRRRGSQIAAQMTDAELYHTPEFASYAHRLLDFILRNHRLYNLKILYDTSPDAPIAYTDGKDITWNTGNHLAAAPTLLERRFKCNMGIAFHEAGHKLFLDFTSTHTALKKIQNGTLHGKFRTNGDPALENAHQELKKVVSSGYSEAIAQVYANIANILADGHDESAMKRTFPGFIAECIETAGEVQFENSSSIHDAVEKRTNAYSILSAMMLYYAKFGTYKVGTETPEVLAYLDKMVNLEPLIDAALDCDRVKDRWLYINLIVLTIWPDLREMFPEVPPDGSQNGSGASQSHQNSNGSSQGGQNGSGSSQGSSSTSQNGQSGSSGTGSGSQNAAPGSQGDPQSNDQSNSQNNNQINNGTQNNTPSPEAIQKALEQIAKDVEQALNAAPAPQNGKGNGMDPASISSGTMSPANIGDLAHLTQKIAEATAASQIQGELDKQQMEMIRNANLPMEHIKVPLNVVRHFTPDQSGYMKIFKEIAPIARNLVSEMKALLRSLNDQYVQRHRMYGPIIEASEAYRPDRAFFAKKRLPDDLPDMALCVLIDESGSMCGDKIKLAKKAAIMLEHFASSIDIPVMIAGHDTNGNTCNLRVYTDFVSAMSDEDRYALANISAGGCNRDGLPIRLCCEMLAKRPERVRLMIVLSDGSPNHRGYAGETARKDITKVITEFRRKGMLIYGAAIDDDREVIESIYGNGFLSIENLTTLPKVLVRLVKQHIT